MYVFDLNHIFRKYGLVMVADMSAYHGFQPEDIDGDKIKEGASPITSFSFYTTNILMREKAEEFIQMCQRVDNRYPYDTAQIYIVSPVEKEEKQKEKIASSWVPRKDVLWKLLFFVL